MGKITGYFSATTDNTVSLISSSEVVQRVDVGLFDSGLSSGARVSHKEGK